MFKSAFGGVWGTTPVFLLSLLFSMLKHHLLYLLFFTLKILSILLILSKTSQADPRKHLSCIHFVCSSKILFRQDLQD